MSPEQVKGEAADRRTDIWSLGVVLYEMVSGRLPFRGDHEGVLARAILDDNPEPLTALRAGLPLELDRIIFKVLAKNPAQRYQNVEDLLVDLRACRKGGQGITRSRGLRWGWIASGVACAITLAAGLWIGRSKREWANPLENARYTRVTDFEGTETDASISPDGKLISFLSDRDGQFDLWVTQTGTQNYRKLTQGTMKGFPRLDDRPLGFTSDAGQVWFHQRQSGSPMWVTMMIPSFGGAIRPFVSAVSLAWSYDGHRLVYHTADSGDPTFISDPDGANAIELFRRDSGVHAHHPVWSPDGRFVYFSSGYPPDQMDIWRVAAGGGTPERLTLHNSRVRCPTLLDNETLLYSATADDGLGSCLYAMNLGDRVPHRVSAGLEQYISLTADEASANKLRRLVATLVSPTASLWSVPITPGVVNENAATRIPTSNAQTQGPRAWKDELFYMAASGPSHSLWRRGQDGPALELWKVSGGGLIAPVAISPDGRLICFSFRRQDKAALYVMNADGTNLRTIANTFQVRSAASWSPDGKWVTVSGDEGKGSRIFKVPVQGGAPVRLLDSESSWPIWSPDGKMIVYAGPNIGGSRTVRAMTPDGNALPFVDLNVIQKMDTYRFLPDGKAIIALQGLAPRQAFWLFELRTGQRRQLTDLQPGYEVQSFDITPDGKQIVFDRVRSNADVVLIELARK